MKRKKPSVRRWVARYRLGKFVPYEVVISTPRLWGLVKDATYEVHRDGYRRATP